MFHLSRALYRDLLPFLGGGNERDVRAHLLWACETTIDRLTSDPDFARPERSLFEQIRWRIPFSDQPRAHRLIELHIAAAQEAAARPDAPVAESRRCSGRSRGGDPCRREALPESEFCPSHHPRNNVSDAAVNGFAEALRT